MFYVFADAKKRTDGKKTIKYKTVAITQTKKDPPYYNIVSKEKGTWWTSPVRTNFLLSVCS